MSIDPDDPSIVIAKEWSGLAASWRRNTAARYRDAIVVKAEGQSSKEFVIVATEKLLPQRMARRIGSCDEGDLPGTIHEPDTLVKLAFSAKYPAQFVEVYPVVVCGGGVCDWLGAVAAGAGGVVGASPLTLLSGAGVTTGSDLGVPAWTAGLCGTAAGAVTGVGAGATGAVALGGVMT